MAIRGAQRRASLDGCQLLRDRSEDHGTVVADGHEVLDANAEAPGHVYPGLDRHDAPALEVALARRRQPRALVDLQSHAMTQAVAELIAAPGRRDAVARHRVDL